MVDIPPIKECARRYGESAERGADEYDRSLRADDIPSREACARTDRYFAGVGSSSGIDPVGAKSSSEGSRDKRIAEALANARERID